MCCSKVAVPASFRGYDGGGMNAYEVVALASFASGLKVERSGNNRLAESFKLTVSVWWLRLKARQGR